MAAEQRRGVFLDSLFRSPGRKQMASWWVLFIMISSVSCATDEQTMISKYIRAYYIPGSGDSSTKFGQSVASLGDVDGDGVVDIAAGTPLDGTSNDGSLVLMFLRTSGAWGGYSILYADDFGMPLNGQARLGYAVAKIDDANSDGIQDLAVSSIGQNVNSPFPEGAVHVAALTRNGDVQSSRTFNGSYIGAVSGSDYGRGIIAVGDWLNIDPSEQDLLVGAPGHDGMGCVFLLTPSDPQRNPPRLCGDQVLSSQILQSKEHDDDYYDDDELGSGMDFGHSLAYLGDKYVAVGSPGSGDGKGAVWLLELDEQLNITGGVRIDTSSLDIAGSYPLFGSSVVALSHSSSGDDDDGGLDGDTTTLDLAIGAERNDGAELDSGAVYLLTVNPSSGEIIRSFKLEDFDGVPYYTGGSISNFLGKRDYFGSSLTCLGDINNDGNIDITVGLPGYGKYVGNSRGGAWATLSLNPILGPSQPPTPKPTYSPAPTHIPSLHPTPRPSTTYQPTQIPTHMPTSQPSTSSQPTKAPTKTPTPFPTIKPTHMPTAGSATYQYSLTGSIGFTIVAWCCVISMMWTCCYAFYKNIIKGHCASSERIEEPDPVRRPSVRIARPSDIPTMAFVETLCYAKFICEKQDQGCSSDSNAGEMCSICLCEMEPQETVKELQCSHCFHAGCLDEWLRVQFICPLCKRRPLPPSSSNNQGSGLVSMQHYLDNPTSPDDYDDTESSLDSLDSSDEEFGEAERGIQMRRIYLPPPPEIRSLPPPPTQIPLSASTSSNPPQLQDQTVLRRPSLVYLPPQMEDAKEQDESSSDYSSEDDDVIEAVLIRGERPSEPQQPLQQQEEPFVAARQTNNVAVSSPTSNLPIQEPRSPENSSRRVFSPDDDPDAIAFIQRNHEVTL